MISVCITTYNGEKYIGLQLESILQQLNREDEIIISDDGSTDNTLSIIQNLEDNRIKILHHKAKKVKYKFSLVTNNLESALRAANGDIIFLSDQDDIWYGEKVRYCISQLNQGYDLILHDCNIINEDGKEINKSYFEINTSKKGIIKNIINNSYLGCCMVFNNKFIDKILPFPNFSVPHDIWIGLIYEFYGNVLFSDKKLISYRRHYNNLSQSAEKSKNSIIFKIKYRINIALSLISRIL